ncbi:ECF transporter S component [Halothermothrix orenii]|uniref:ECF transporter S component n=1 Tax=Halothermothrix orenii (strain H 168 / OCM 544 / DSM 9562) TaxID=373903 RepID=B8CZ60_HALOH|nr:ECF transporter S component [Halothermothrix orenii]ACL70579.1 hypothetical protein Hore_18300 [Halothermothrix orenii H 168]
MNQNNVKFITRTAILLAIALVFQMGGFPQMITGPVVNTVLYVAAMLVGISGGVIIGIFTPVIAFIRGILPGVLAPMIPFIAAGNAVLVIIFALLKKKNKILAVVAASAVKFLLLAGAVQLLLKVLSIKIPGKVAQAMSFPQLVTALIGGIIALLVYKGLEATNLDLGQENKLN